MGKRVRDLKSVPNLLTIPSLRLLVIVKMVPGEFKDAGVVDVNSSMVWSARCLGCFDLVKSYQIDLEDLNSLFFVQRRIIEADVSSRFESLIDGANTVGCQEQDAIVVFKHSKEHCHCFQ